MNRLKQRETARGRKRAQYGVNYYDEYGGYSLDGTRGGLLAQLQRMRRAQDEERQRQYNGRLSDMGRMQLERMRLQREEAMAEHRNRMIEIRRAEYQRMARERERDSGLVEELRRRVLEVQDRRVRAEVDINGDIQRVVRRRNPWLELMGQDDYPEAMGGLVSEITRSDVARDDVF